MVTERAGNLPGKFDVFKWLRCVTDAPELSGNASAVALALIVCQRAGNIDAVAVETLAGRAHLSARSAKRGLSELRKAGLAEPVKRYGHKGRKANGYRLITGHIGPKGRGQIGPKAPAPIGANMAHLTRVNNKRGRDEIFVSLDWPS